METSTPQRHDMRRRSLLNMSHSVSSPLRRSHALPSPSAAVLEPADDEQERSNRRSMVAIQRRLTNITSTSSLSPLVDSNPIIEESQIKDHLRICTKLYTENRISAKNAWQLHVIDVMRKLASTGSANVLQVAGSSLDIGAKVYGLRVDDVHAKGLQLASSMAKMNEKQQAQDEGGEDVNLENSDNQGQRRKNTRKKTKKLASDKRNTIDKEGKTLYAPIKHIESVVFATKENIDVSATDNLFTHKLPTNPGTHELMLLSEEKYWSQTFDQILGHGDALLDIEVPQVSHYNICVPFKEFETGTWDPEEEERLLAEATIVPDAVLDDNGLPIAELDGSIHDIFEDNPDVAEDSANEAEEQQEVFQAQIHGGIAHIIDAVPEENRIQTDYGYNTLVRTTSGKYIDKIWAGPSHWKVKFNRRSTARFSGSAVHQVVKHTRKNKVPQKMDWSVTGDDLDDLCETIDKHVVKRAPPTSTYEKLTLPVPECFQNFQVITEELLMKPGVPFTPLNNNNIETRNYEVPVYNYENPNDSQYCSQHNSDDANDGEPMEHSYEEDAPPAAQQQFLDENLVLAPETVSSTHIKYAMQAKKMDMKKLKAGVWKCITSNSGEHEDNNRNNTKIQPTQFSALYKALPQTLTAEMRKELTCPLALVALLHLANENNLNLVRGKDGKDFTITKAVE